MKKKIRDLKVGEFFRLKDSETAPVWIRCEYVRIEGANKYSCTRFEDITHENLMSGDREVYVEFTF